MIATKPREIFVNGEWLGTDATRSITLPYDGAPVAEVCDADPALVDRAIESACAATKEMAALPNYARADLLLKLRDVLKSDIEEIARTITLETGKTIREARVEADRGLQTLLAAANAARELRGESVPMDAAPAGIGRMAITVREPLGVIGAITPFNFPFNLSLHKIAPALAAGNTVVHKPSENTPLSALNIAAALEKCGAPKGCYNVVTGDGESVGKQIVTDPRIAMITFTGSVPVGKSIRANSGLKRVTLELGGNCALIVDANADLQVAVARSVAGAFSYSGQTCISVQRIYIHEELYGAFRSELVDAVSRLRIGHPLEESTDIASLITEEAAERVQEWIEEARRGGANVLTGGTRNKATVSPTVLEDAPENLRIAREEAFGPVVLLYSYREIDDAITRANATNYGLQAGIFTRDLHRAFHAARLLRTGGVMINDVPTFRADHMPYGGVKESGIGREGPRYAIEEMTELKLICWKL